MRKVDHHLDQDAYYVNGFCKWWTEYKHMNSRGTDIFSDQCVSYDAVSKSYDQQSYIHNQCKQMVFLQYAVSYASSKWNAMMQNSHNNCIKMDAISHGQCLCVPEAISCQQSGEDKYHIFRFLVFDSLQWHYELPEKCQ
jgi:hypothetical protein